MKGGGKRPHRRRPVRAISCLAALLLGTPAAAEVTAEDLWNEHVGSDATAPRVEAVNRIGPERTTAPQRVLRFHVRFTEPVLADPGDFDILGVHGEWRRVELQHDPHHDEQDRLLEAEDPFFKPCFPDRDRIYAHLGTSAGYDLINRLLDECDRRKDMSRHWSVAGNVYITHGEVNLGIHPDHDLVDAAGNLLDPRLPTGDDYEGYIVDRRGPKPVVTADVATHDGYTPFNVRIDFTTPVRGFRASDLFFPHGAIDSVTGSDGDQVYDLVVTPPRSRHVAVQVRAFTTTTVSDGVGNQSSRSLILHYDPVGVSFTPRELSVPEGGTGSYRVALETRPRSDVTVDIGSGVGDDDISVQGSSRATFTPSNWETPQTITLAAAEDDDCRIGSRTFTASVTSTDPAYGDLTPRTLTAREGEADSDCTAPRVQSITRHGAAATEGRQGFTNADELMFRVTFSEPVVNVDAADFEASGTTADVTAVTGSGAAYDVTVRGGDLADLNGEVGLTVGGGQDIADLARKPNLLVDTTPSGSDERYTLDNTAPTVALARTDGLETTLNESFDVTVTFTEVNGLRRSGPGSFRLADDDVVATNGTVESLAPVGTAATGAPLAYTAHIVPDPGVTGEVLVDVPAGALMDYAGNDNTAATQLSVSVDNNMPALESVVRHSSTPSDSNGITNSDSLAFAVTFSEDVDNVDDADFITTAGGGATGTASGSGSEYVVTFTGGTLADHDGEVGLALATNHGIRDAAGNALAGDAPGTNQNYLLDNTAPVVTLTRADGAQSTLNGAFDVTVTFTETNGLQTSGQGAFAQTDLAVTNGSPTSVSATPGNPRVWTARIAPSTGLVDNVIVNLPANAVRDVAGNGNVAATPLNVPVDNVQPTVLRVERHDGMSALDALTNSDSLKFRVTFSEAVRDVGIADFDATGAGDATDVTGGAEAWVVTVEGDGLSDHNGEVGLSLASNQDIADEPGNRLDATLPTGASYQTYTLDNTGPQLTHIVRHDGQRAFPAATTADELKFRVAFSQAVTGVDAADFVATEPGGGTATTATVTALTADTSPGLYLLTLGGGNLADYVGEVGLGLASSHGIADTLGNPLDTTTVANAANQSYEVNLAGPAPTLSTDAEVHTGSGTIVNVDIDFGEGVNGLLASEVTVMGGTPGNIILGDDGAILWTVQIAPSGTADVAVSLAAGVATDLAGNATLASSNTLVIPYRAPIDDIEALARQSYTVGTAITDLTLPEGSGGDGGPYMYSLTGPDGGPLPSGLTFDTTTRTLSGTPNVAGNTVLTYRISDSAGASAQAFFVVAVAAALPTGSTPTLVLEDITLAEGQSGMFDVVLSHAVSGGFTVTISPTGSLAENYLITPATLTFAGTAGEKQQFTAASLADDDEAGGDITVTLTLTASGDQGGVVDDSDTAVLTINDDETEDVDTTLRAFGLSADGDAVTLSPAFTSNTTVYTASVASEVATVTVAATANAAGATVAFTPAMDADTVTAGHQVALAPGANTITATVTNGSETQPYTVVVTRAEALSWTATLTVGTAAGFGGYCDADCERLGPSTEDSWGGLTDGTDNAFTIPGTSDSVAVTALTWATDSMTVVGDGDLILRLSLIPEASVYEAWTLTVGSISVSLADSDGGVTDKNGFPVLGTLRFNDFFGTGNPPSLGTAVTVSLTAGGASGTVGGTAGVEPGLAARFGPHPTSHTGMAFWTELHFSAEPKLGYRDVRDKLFEVSGGRIARAQRLVQGSNAQWRLQVVPAGFDDVSLSLPPTVDCAAEGAVCTKQGEPLEQPIDLTVPGPGEKLAARLTGHESSHAGVPFELELHFSHAPNLGYRDVRDRVFDVTGGRIERARRLVQGSNIGWRLTVRPAGAGAVALELPATQSCDDDSAVCTKDGRRLETGLAVSVRGPTAFSVADAQVDEAPGAVLAFEVSLSRRRNREARVDVHTRDGTAAAGADYEALTQTLLFAPGETAKTVEVPVLDDAHDEGSETMTLVLSNASGAELADAEATGTIVNADAMPQAWLARFGRTVTGQVLDAVEDRISSPRREGRRGRVLGLSLGAASQSTRTGNAPGDAVVRGGTTMARAVYRADASAMGTLGTWLAADDNAYPARRGGFGPRTQQQAWRDVLNRSSFDLTSRLGKGGGYGSLWGRGSMTHFGGREDGLALSGEVATALVGVDLATNRWTAGVALGRSSGTGRYRRSCGTTHTNCGGDIDATLFGMYPYAGVSLGDRLSVWAAGGHGRGTVTVAPDGLEAIPTDLAMSMGATGLRAEMRSDAGLRLAVLSDARFTRTSSVAVRAPDGGNMAAAQADVWLARAGFEASRPFAFGTDGSALSMTPSVELAARFDGGDAETGFGADVGGGLNVTARRYGLGLDLKGRALVVHQADGFREWGASARVGYDPQPSTERGLALSLTQAWGVSPSGGMDALLSRETLAGFAAGGASGFQAAHRLEARIGYGIEQFRGRFTAVPNFGVGVSGYGREYRLGWRLASATSGSLRVGLNVDAIRRESLLEAPVHGIRLQGTLLH